VSRTSKHAKPSSLARRSGGAHRKINPGSRRRPGRVAAVLLGFVLAAAGFSYLAAHGSRVLGQAAAFNHASGKAATGHQSGLADPAGTSVAAIPSRSRGNRFTSLQNKRGPARRHSRPSRVPAPAASVTPGYANPLRAVSGLIPERIDMGVDFGGAGPVYALGDAVITNATAGDAGWPGGGWITYRLTSGPAAGLTVYLAEDVTPDVHVGEVVTSSTVIATMFVGGDGIEFGWAQPDGSSAESQLAVAGGISGGGPFPTVIGLNFEELLQSLGVPAANNRYSPPYGLLPAGYPTAW
jgi:hypothetical protein